MGPKITIPKHIWNAYNPRLQNNFTRIGKSRVSGKPTNCKVKLTRFHYGGPQRRRRGQWRNEITYEQPCLELSCISCWKWHPHLLREQARTSASQETAGSLTESSMLGRAESTFGDVQGKTPATRSALEYFGPALQAATTHFVPAKMTYNARVPTPLARTNPSKQMKLSLPPRRLYNVKLRFLSRQGKKKFKDLVQELET